MPDLPANNDRQHFDEWSETYEHSFMQWLIFDRVHRALLRRIPTGFSPLDILDIGCGTGRLLRKLHDQWPAAALVGIDTSEGMVTRARRLTPNATIYQASAEHIPLEDASINMATSTMSFHHWTEQSLGVQEIYRVLSRGGLFILADTNIGHGHPLSRPQVRQLFRAAGLSIRSQNNLVPLLSITVGEKA
jgi:ubiquinone/menaquinone biosynthesis C-methylase UbiE